MSKQSKAQFRQIVARRDTEEGYVETVQMLPEKDIPAAGELVFIPSLKDPDKPWKIVWRAAHVSMQPV